MKSNNRSIYNKIAEVGLIGTLVGLITKYEWNNMIHNQVEKVITLVIDSASEELKVALFEKANLLEFIADACSETEYTMGNPKQRKIRRGYLGQLVRISNKILEVKDPYIQKIAEESQPWKDYVSGELAKTNERNKINFGGRDPRIPEEEETKEVNLELPSFMQKFTKFFNQRAEQKNQHKPDSSNDEDGDEDQNLYEEDDEPKKDDEDDEDVNDRELTTDDLQSDNNAGAPPPVKGRASFGHVRKEHKQPEDDLLDLQEKPELIYVEAQRIIELGEKPIEESSEEYYDNKYFKNESGHNIDDILKEFESN